MHKFLYLKALSKKLNVFLTKFKKITQPLLTTVQRNNKGEFVTYAGKIPSQC